MAWKSLYCKFFVEWMYQNFARREAIMIARQESQAAAYYASRALVLVFLHWQWISHQNAKLIRKLAKYCSRHRQGLLKLALKCWQRSLQMTKHLKVLHSRLLNLHLHYL